MNQSINQSINQSFICIRPMVHTILKIDNNKEIKEIKVTALNTAKKTI